MRQKIIAGNWKMNNDKEETKSLINSLKSISFSKDVKVMIAPSYIHLSDAAEMLKDHKIDVLAQNMHFLNNGAYTGEISPQMLKSIGISKVILGHSERRIYYNETENSLKQKIKAAIESNFEIIFCFGEQLSDRKKGKHFDLIKNQLKIPLFHLESNSWKRIILAYEPVWAIGTGETATPNQVQEMHSFIRGLIKQNYNDDLANRISILYGGSVKSKNSKEIFSKDDVDGGLIGGASLDFSEFVKIIESI
tara:strand:- start:215 stop:964 length:750 start_codon:yes stop_codon:yes gene_type:complete